MIRLTFLFVTLFSLKSYARTEVAFFEIYQNGSVIKMTEDGSYSHVAIKTSKGWLHAHPKHGVILNDFLSDFDFENYRVEILVDESIEIDENYVLSFLGREYDTSFDWESDKLYCSKLIALSLGVEPSPMNFKKSLWGNYGNDKRGKPGISPMKVYNALLAKGFKSKDSTCYTSMSVFFSN